MTFKKLGIKLEGIAKGLPARAADSQKKIALIIDSTVVLATPVDTGRARMNWIMSIGEPSSATLPDTKQRFTRQAATQTALAAARRVLDSHKPGATIWLSNNLPYIQRLNNGTSKQAPAGFVEKAIQAVERSEKVRDLL